MKTLALLISSLFISIASFADVSKYEQTMLEQIDKLYKVKSAADYQPIINTFDRIAAKESDKWEPLYYAGYAYSMMAVRSADPKDKDKYLDLGLEKVKQGQQLAQQESELVTLEGFIHMIRLSIDPASRGQQYSGLSMGSFGKALAMDPENPRASYLMAQMKIGTAKFFGSDTAEACGEIKAAINKFDTYKSDNVLSPQWGKGQAMGSAEQCD